MNTFLDIKNIINYILKDNIIIFKNSKEYNKCISELYTLLLNTLKTIENIYYKYILLPKLEMIVK